MSLLRNQRGLHRSSLLLGNPLRFFHPLNLIGRGDSTCSKFTNALALRFPGHHKRLHHSKVVIALEGIYSIALFINRELLH